MSQTPDLGWLNGLDNQDERLGLLFRAVESAKHGIIITDAKLEDNPIIYSNQAFLDLTGYSMAEILGRNCRFLQGEDRNQAGVEIIRTAIRNAQPVTALLRNYRKDGRLFWNELSISPVHDQSGKLTNFIGIQNDVTARLDSERRVSNFYSVISHELKTPLTAIHGALGAIDDGAAGKISKPVARLVTIAMDNCARLIDLVDQILDWKRLEASKFDIVKRPVAPGDLLAKLVEQLEVSSRNSQVCLRTEVETEQKVFCDFDRTLQVLSNLTNNAIKFSPADSTVTVRVCRTANGKIRFSIVDQGPGIAQEELQKLFVHFQQTESAEKRRKGGAGLGLAISKSIVELHGGTIGIDQPESGGCTFWFELSAAKSRS